MIRRDEHAVIIPREERDVLASFGDGFVDPALARVLGRIVGQWDELEKQSRILRGIEARKAEEGG